MYWPVLMCCIIWSVCKRGQLDTRNKLEYVVRHMTSGVSRSHTVPSCQDLQKLSTPAVAHSTSYWVQCPSQLQAVLVYRNGTTQKTVCACKQLFRARSLACQRPCCKQSSDRTSATALICWHCKHRRCWSSLPPAGIDLYKSSSFLYKAARQKLEVGPTSKSRLLAQVGDN